MHVLINLGVINNVIYVVILSAALDLVGPDIPKGLVLLADDVPSFMAKLVVPYFIHNVPYWTRVLAFCVLSSGGIITVALTPSISSGGSVAGKLVGIVFGSLSCGVGEATFLAMTHFYGQSSLAAWGSGTGGAGLVGAGLYFLFTSVVGLTVKTSLLESSFLPIIMLISFFIILPHEPMHSKTGNSGYRNVPQDERSDDEGTTHANVAAPSLDSSLQLPFEDDGPPSHSKIAHSSTLSRDMALARDLFLPYVLPLILVYVGEYTINQAVAPTLLFPLDQTPFTHYRSFYPFYNLLYQIGVLVARTSIAFVRIRSLYAPSMLQLCNLLLLISHALYNWIPSVWIVFAMILWEGLLGGTVYVNTFATILEEVKEEDREFSLGLSSVGTSAGICIAASLGILIEPRLCEWQVERGRGWCRIYDG